MSAFVTMPKHYSVEKLDKETGMQVLRDMFPTGEADDYQFVLFSTSGVHGTYLSIENVAKSLDTKEPCGLTVLIIHHRTCFFQYGEIKIAKGDVPFLKKLRKSSIKRVKEINAPYG